MTIITDMLAHIGKAWGPASFGMRMASGPYGTMASIGDGRGTNSPSDLRALTEAFAAEKARNAQAYPAVDAMADHAPQTPYPMVDAMAAHAPQAPPVRVPITGGTQEGPVPMPMARPADAPQTPPDISWFLRNAYNQRDQQTGEQIDPAMAQQYEARNPFAGLFRSS